MTGSIGSRAIAGGSFGDGTELEDGTWSGDVKRGRVRVASNRHGDEPAPEPTATPSPTYDTLNPEQRMKVDRMIVAMRLQKMRGIA